VRSSSSRSRPLRLAARLAGALAVALVFALPAAAGDVRVDLVVSFASHDKGPMEQPNLLPPGFDFQSHRVLESKTLDLAMGQEVRERLPNGKTLTLRPTSLEGGQLMMHVAVEGATRSDLRMRDGKRVTIRHPEPYQGGNLLIHLEPHF